MSKLAYTNKNSSVTFQAIVDIFPLAISVIPWGILCGSMAIQTGFSPIQAQFLSLFVFAGAAQLSGMSIIGSSGSIFSLISSTSVISSRYLLYSATFRDDVRHLPFFKRFFIAFLLTDEMFAVTETYKQATGKLSVKYAIISGLTFYIIWNISTFIGIYAGTQIPKIESLGLEFAIAATFIAMVIPSIKTHPTLVAVLSSGVSATALYYLKIENGLILSAFIGMFAGYFVKLYQEKNG